LFPTLCSEYSTRIVRVDNCTYKLQMTFQRGPLVCRDELKTLSGGCLILKVKQTLFGIWQLQTNKVLTSLLY
jgi:hypothetical protein